MATLVVVVAAVDVVAAAVVVVVVAYGSTAVVVVHHLPFDFLPAVDLHHRQNFVFAVKPVNCLNKILKNLLYKKILKLK